MRASGWVLGLVVGASLACGGEQFAKSILGADVQQGAGAELPADFPLTPPDGATLSVVMKADLLGMTTVTAVFELGTADAAAALEAAAVAFEAQGMTVQRTPDTVTGTRGTDNFVASLGDVEGKPGISYIIARGPTQP
jgi:hypothetical protein